MQILWVNFHKFVWSQLTIHESTIIKSLIICFSSCLVLDNSPNNESVFLLKRQMAITFSKSPR